MAGAEGQLTEAAAGSSFGRVCIVALISKLCPILSGCLICKLQLSFSLSEALLAASVFFQALLATQFKETLHLNWITH